MTIVISTKKPILMRLKNVDIQYKHRNLPFFIEILLSHDSYLSRAFIILLPLTICNRIAQIMNVTARPWQPKVRAQKNIYDLSNLFIATPQAINVVYIIIQSAVIITLNQLLLAFNSLSVDCLVNIFLVQYQQSAKRNILTAQQLIEYGKLVVNAAPMLRFRSTVSQFGCQLSR